MCLSVSQSQGRSTGRGNGAIAFLTEFFGVTLDIIFDKNIGNSPRHLSCRKKKSKMSLDNLFCKLKSTCLGDLLQSLGTPTDVIGEKTYSRLLTQSRQIYASLKKSAWSSLLN